MSEPRHTAPDAPTERSNDRAAPRTHATQTALVTRRGVLPTIAVGAIIGAVVGVAIDRRATTADPTFAGAIGAGIGAVLGRSAWIRIGVARRYGIPAAAMLGVVFGRILGCVLLGYGIIRTSPQRFAFIGVGAILLIATAIVEQRWLRRRTAEGGAMSTAGDTARPRERT